MRVTKYLSTEERNRREEKTRVLSLIVTRSGCFVPKLRLPGGLRYVVKPRQHYVLKCHVAIPWLGLNTLDAALHEFRNLGCEFFLGGGFRSAPLVSSHDLRPPDLIPTKVESA